MDTFWDGFFVAIGSASPILRGIVDKANSSHLKLFRHFNGGWTNGVAIDLQDPTEAVVLSGNEILETSLEL